LKEWSRFDILHHLTRGIIKGVAVPALEDLRKALAKEGALARSDLGLMALSRSGSTSVRRTPAGGVWITNLGWHLHKKELLLSAHFSPVGVHHAITVGKDGTKRTVAKAGQWAVSIQDSNGDGGRPGQHGTLQQRRGRGAGGPAGG